MRKRYFRKALASSMMKRRATTVVCSIEAPKRLAHDDSKAAVILLLQQCCPQGSWSQPGCNFWGIHNCTRACWKICQTIRNQSTASFCQLKVKDGRVGLT